jgi:hypothetical protein
MRYAKLRLTHPTTDYHSSGMRGLYHQVAIQATAVLRFLPETRGGCEGPGPRDHWTRPHLVTGVHSRFPVPCSIQQLGVLATEGRSQKIASWIQSFRSTSWRVILRNDGRLES